MTSFIRIALAAILGCLAAGVVHELFAADTTGRGPSLQSIVDMAWLSAKWAAPFAIFGIIVGELLRLRSGLVYLLGGLLIALGAGLLYRDGNVPEIASLFRVPSFTALMSMGTIGGLGYGEGKKPETLAKAKGKADDLQLIWGVGPKLEEKLLSLGFFHFDQIAKWNHDNVVWVETQLGEFADRIERDEWVSQSKKLATGWRPKDDVGEKPKK